VEGPLSATPASRSAGLPAVDTARSDLTYDPYDLGIDADPYEGEDGRIRHLDVYLQQAR
jgi:hypothetical protein